MNLEKKTATFCYFEKHKTYVLQDNKFSNQTTAYYNYIVMLATI